MSLLSSPYLPFCTPLSAKFRTVVDISVLGTCEDFWGLLAQLIPLAAKPP